MKLNFQQRLIASFLVIFTLFAVGIVLFEQRSARRYKTEALEERLNAYAGVVAQFLEANGDRANGEEALPDGEDVVPDTLLGLMPPQMRLTLIERDGRVAYDNVMHAGEMENHMNRPEFREAMATGRGTAIRTSTSSSVGERYLYFAKDTGGRFVVRVALPYNIEVRSFLKPDNGFLYFVVALFLIGLGFIYSIGRYFAEAVERLRQHEAKEKTRRLKQEMTGNIAHELRTPVTSIRGFLEIVLTGDPEPQKAREYLERAYRQTRTLSELIADMSLLARIDERRDAFDFAEGDIAELLAKVQSDASGALAEKHISFVTDIPSGLVLRGNESLLYSVFRNLTDNVIAHAGEGVEIRIGAVAERGIVRFSFADTGRGISSEAHLERIFERFYRVNEGRTRDTGGSGLGLSIVKNTVALHGGEISVRPNRPHGLEFVFVLPGEVKR